MGYFSGYFSGNSYINFIKNDGWQYCFVGKCRFNCQHQPRNFAARSHFIQFRQCHSFVGGKEELHIVNAIFLQSICFTPIVISHLFDAAKAINTVHDGKGTISAPDLAELKSVFHVFIEDVLGLQTETTNESNEAYKKAIDLLLEIRLQAKQNKDWATSDKIRNELTGLGFNIKDTKDGFEWNL